ncbi:callose synthase 11-like [Gossypium australe]|uniref:Callose synthase 11-like n=1 Tax=Gossypium australe TaxID=47621 RepID=A0A5B6WU59_9ROSI|nr:callose synthase 11-like [Gossypium australe]
MAGLLFKNAVEFPDLSEEHFYMQIKRLHTILTTRDSMHTVPVNNEARRRLAFFSNSLFMKMPRPPRVEKMIAFSVLAPFNNEHVLYSEEQLKTKNEDGISILYYLQTIYDDEWKNFIERMHRERMVTADEIWTTKLRDLRLWASYRGQTFAHTVRGMMYYYRALRLLAFLDSLSETDITVTKEEEGIALMKYTYVVSCQKYWEHKAIGDPRAEEIMDLLKHNEALRMAYVDQVSTGSDEKEYYPVLVKYDRQLQQSGSVSSVAWFMSAQETSFVTLFQRLLANLLKIRMHYGHPDVFDRFLFMTRGGLSKASKVINITEDIFAGFNCTLRGGSVTHHEYIQVGKGRDLGLNQISTFEAKIACWNGEHFLSRDVYSGVENSVLGNNTNSKKAVSAVTNQKLIIQFGLFMTLPAILESSVKSGFLEAIWEFLVMQLQLSTVFYTFSMGTRVHFWSDCPSRSIFAKATESGKVGGQSGSVFVYLWSWIFIFAAFGIYLTMSYVWDNYGAKKHIYVRLAKFLLMILGILLVIALRQFTAFKYVDVFTSLLALVPTGWGLISIAQEFRPLLRHTRLWDSVVSLARYYEMMFGVIVMGPVAVLSWMPGFQSMQTRIQFNDAFSKGLQMFKIITQKVHEKDV